MRRERKFWPFPSEANVWGIANIVASLQIQTQGFGDWNRFKNYKEATWYDWQLAPYSSQLRSIIEDCMHFDPNDRLDLKLILKRICARKIPRQNSSSPPLPVAAAHSSEWNGHRIDPEFLDLICTL